MAENRTAKNRSIEDDLAPLTFIIPESNTGRLDTVLTQLVSEKNSEELSFLTRSQLKKLIEGGYVYVNENVVKKAGAAVEEGDEVSLELPEATGSDLLPYEFPLDIIYEEDSFLVLNKPPGIPVHPGAGTGEKTLLNALIYHQKIEAQNFQGSMRPGIVHRLDKDTTGVMVVAKTQASLSNLSSQFHDRTVQKRYQTLALRKPRGGGLPFEESAEGEIQAAIARSSKNKLRMVVEEGGKPAITRWQIVEAFLHGVLLDIELLTGRTHQIRVHLEHVGSGIIGDPTYGNFDTLPNTLSILAKEFGRQALHSRYLRFAHPKSGEPCEFEAPVPSEMLNLIASFREES